MAEVFTYDGKQYNKPEFKKLMERLLEFYRGDSRLSAVLKMAQGRKVLDVGCHMGFFSRILAENDKEVVAVDILGASIDIAKAFNQIDGVQYKKGDLFELKFADNEFDVIVFLETIEHLNEPTLFLKEFFRILRPGGCLIVSTPNPVSYMNILYQALFFSKKDSAGSSVL